MQMSPLSTLESSFEALNVKKFDGDYTSFPNLIATLDRSTVNVLFFSFFLFQLHLQLIHFIIRHPHNLMKAGPRVF